MRKVHKAKSLMTKKTLLRLYYQRALGVALVEYLETANAHKGRIDEILTWFDRDKDLA